VGEEQVVGSEEEHGGLVGGLGEVGGRRTATSGRNGRVRGEVGRGTRRLGRRVEVANGDWSPRRGGSPPVTVRWSMGPVDKQFGGCRGRFILVFGRRDPVVLRAVTYSHTHLTLF
jgi:hypothetical protein